LLRQKYNKAEAAYLIMKEILKKEKQKEKQKEKKCIRT